METLTRTDTLPRSGFTIPEAIEQLTRARDRIATPRRWFQGAYAPPGAKTPDECPVCAMGAIRWAVAGVPLGRMLDDPLEGRVRTADLLAGDISPYFGYGDSIVAFNDDAYRTHPEVLHAFNLAITRLLGDDGELDGRFPNVEWRIEGDGGSWGVYATKVIMGGADVDAVRLHEGDGYDTAEAAYTSMVELLAPEALF